MANKFAERTAFIRQLKGDISGKWCFDTENDGGPELPKVTDFCWQ